MNVTLCSSFRDAAGPQIDAYFERIDGLAEAIGKGGDVLSLVLGYGDSTDGTGYELYEAADHRLVETLLLDVSHGGPKFGSVEDPQRFRQLAYVANRLAACIPHTADAVIFVESDLLWQPPTLLALLDRLERCPAIAPMIMDGPASFYDVFAHRRGGVRFTKEPPYHPDINGRVLQVDSAGSCVAVRGALARTVKFPPEDVFVGWCRGVYAAGGSVWLDPSLIVRHP